MGRRHNLNILALAKDFPYEAHVVVPSHLKSLQAVELAARKRSFNEAAEVLGITPAAVGQRVKTLTPEQWDAGAPGLKTTMYA